MLDIENTLFLSALSAHHQTTGRASSFPSFLITVFVFVFVFDVHEDGQVVHGHMVFMNFSLIFSKESIVHSRIHYEFQT
jgi:hypothetical protein